MSLAATWIDDLSSVNAQAFQSLDRTLGASGALGRIRQLAHDPRWQARYLVVTRGGRLRAAIPVYLGRGGAWSDQMYSSEAWRGTASPPLDDCALIGGRVDIRGSLHCAPEPDVVALVGEILDAAPDLRNRQLYLGYLDDAQKMLADRILGAIDWVSEYDDFVYPSAVVSGDPTRLTKKVRERLWQDVRRISGSGISSRSWTWSDYRSDGAELIAAQNTRKGLVDYSELVAYRMERWDECDGVEVLVAEATASDCRAAVTMILSSEELEVLEIGLPETNCAHRHQLYLTLTFHQPLALARARGVGRVRVGMGSATPKKLRGALLVTRHCGIRAGSRHG